jgi:hypothetical protein
MKTLLSVAALVLLLGLTFGAQAQDDSTRLEDALSAYLDTLKSMVVDLTKALESAALPACADLDDGTLRASHLDDAVSDGTVYCREITRDGSYLINPGAIGSQRIVQRGVLQAYDVFGMTDAGVAVQRFEHSILVCLEGRGDLVFLPGFVSPRPAQMPQSYTTDDFTCTRIGSPGIVALVEN